jgi:hypothetical protein
VRRYIAGLLLMVVVAAAFSPFGDWLNASVWSPFVKRAMSTTIGTAIAESSWLFAIIESVHLIGLSLLGGAVLIVDSALIGILFRGESVAKIARAADPWLRAGIALTMSSGVLLFLSEATKFHSYLFWDSAEAPFIFKMLFLALAIGFTLTIRRGATQLVAVQAPTDRQRAIGILSVLLWTSVAVGGRAIGFY